MSSPTLTDLSADSPASPPPFPVLELDNEDAIVKDRVKILAWGYYLHGAINMVMVSFLLIHLAIFSAVSLVPSAEKAMSGEVLAEVAVQVPEEEDAALKEDTLLMTTDESMDTLVRGEEHNVRRNQDFRQMQMVMRWLSVVIGMIILAGWAFGLLTIYAGRCLTRHSRRTFVLVMGGLNCLFIPYGTILGICTFILLTKPIARRLFRVT